MTPTSTTVYAVVGTAPCTSNPAAVTLNITSAPTVISNPFSECDEGTGTANFDLNSYNNIVNANSGNSVNWFLDNAGTISAPSPFNTSTTTVYAVVSNGNCNSLPTAITLNVANAPTAVTTSDQACDDGSGMAIFNLAILNNTVNASSGNSVNWFLDMAATIPAPDPITTTSITVYAVVNNGFCDSAPTPVSYTHLTLPTICSV